MKLVANKAMMSPHTINAAGAPKPLPYATTRGKKETTDTIGTLNASTANSNLKVLKLPRSL